jgi:hypothetical protein
MDLLLLPNKFNITLANDTVSLYNEDIIYANATRPYFIGILSLVTTTSTAIFIYACYVITRTFKIYQKSFILTILILISLGTISGTISIGY